MTLGIRETALNTFIDEPFNVQRIRLLLDAIKNGTVQKEALGWSRTVILMRDIPDSLKELISLPGVGPNTAGAIMAYRFNEPVVFIETNIRTVYFPHYFGDQGKVSDAEIKVVLETTLYTEHPREFYWAFMD